MLFSRIEKVELKEVTKVYGNLTAVDAVSLEVYGGELLVLIGPSGSGKTTLLRMINRLVEPDGGEVYINGRNVREFDIVKLRRNIGYVIQQIGLFPHLSVKENIALLMRLEGVTRGLRRELRNLWNWFLYLTNFLTGFHTS